MGNESIEHWTVRGQAVHHGGGMVAAQHLGAARAGAAQLAAGGNAVDAALAAALALGVLEPWMCGLGGSGLMTLWLAGEGRAEVIDFQGVLARATSVDDYPIDTDLPETLMGFPTVRDRANVEGYRSITVPGAAAGFELARERHGTRSRAEIVAPALALARGGITADWFTTLQIALEAEKIAADAASRELYLPGGHPLLPERHWRVPALADTLEAFARGGAESFYRGELAERLVADLAAGGSRITVDDLAGYRAHAEEAQMTRHRGARLFTPGESSGGRRLADALRHVAAEMPAPPPSPSAATWPLYADALDVAWHRHDALVGRTLEAGSCTSHLSAVDARGNFVALTHTLLNRFGSGVTLPSTGLLMNNALSYFDPRPGRATTMAPAKRINASNMCPTVALRADGSGFAIGASGGNLIVPAVMQVAALMLDFGMTLEAALNSPRLDASGRGSVRADPALGEAVLEALRRREGELEIAQRLVFPKLYACVSGVSRDGSGACAGASDPSHPSAGASGPLVPAANGARETHAAAPEVRP